MSCITPPKYVINVLKRLESHGYSAYMVGGCVRDIIMNRRPNDWDICTSALPEEVMSVFPNSRPTGIKHGTVTVIEHGSTVEVTTFRADGEYLDHRRPENVRFITDLRGDLERRDFTVNALAIPLSGLIFDPFGGRIDIEKKLIRCVGDPDKRFQEDALRMLRAFRFSAVLGFEIEAQTLSAIGKNASLSNALAIERVCAELEKILLSNSPQVISDVIEHGLLSGIIEGRIAKSELAVLKTLPKNRSQRWAGLCALLQKNGLINYIEEFLFSLRLDSATIHNSTAGCKLVMKKAPSNRLEWKKLLSRNGTDIGKCAAAAAEVLYGTGYIKMLHAVMCSGECYSLKRLSVTGDDLMELGFRGIDLGNALYALLDHVIEFPSDNYKTILLDMAKEIKADSVKHRR
ncbi:MAG: CCA tRNA nucleotidyltransferase [Clostridiales bacterium]|nr:CCA tRNA nucleotidyltransferase [Clostridiales bacterium]